MAKRKKIEAWAVDEDGQYFVFTYKHDALDRIQELKENIECGRAVNTHPKLRRLVEYSPDIEAIVRAARKADHPSGTFCGECGPFVHTDKIGCCVTCRMDATGEWARRAAAVFAGLERLQKKEKVR